MSRLLFLFVAIIFVFSVTVVHAQSDKSRGQGQGQNNENRGNSPTNDVVVSNTEVTPLSSPSNRGQGNQKVRVASASAQPSCDPSLEWKNHGEYVKCVAKLKQGGQAVSEAARSDVGKKKTGTPSASLSPSPTATGSASPEATESATPSATVSPSPEATESGIISSTVNNIVGGVKGFFKKVKSFFFFN
jgi:hypothetical protein